MASTNQCIGSYYDELKHRIFYFNYSSAAYHGIYVYSLKTNTIEPLLISYIDSQEDIFGFDPKYPIVSINILYRTEEDGDVLHWTDRNNRPMKINIRETGLDRPAGMSRIAANVYGTNWKKEYLTVARKVPTLAPTCNYSTVPASTSNNLSSKLFQFSYRWVYRDNTKSTWGPWSTLVPPPNVNDTTVDTTVSNNVMNVFYKTGNVDVVKIEMSVRESIQSTFSDRMLVSVIDKAKSLIPDNITNVYDYYNDQVYPFVDATDSTQLFDYVPKKANSQELLNGNILTYGGITEGNTFTGKLSVSKTTGTVTPTNALVITGKSNGSAWSFTFSGIPAVGDIIVMTVRLFYLTSTGGIPVSTTKNYSYTYTVVTGNTLNSVINYFSNIIGNESDLNTTPITNGFNIVYPGTAIQWSVTGTATVTLIDPSAIPDNNISIYKHSSVYKFGLVYFDEFGVTNGVITDNSMQFMTDKLSVVNIGVGNNNIIPYPRINFSINHKPPTWAKTFSFVRTKNLTNSNFTWATTNGIYKDTTGTYAYMDILAYNSNSSGFPTYQYKKGDRIIIYAVLGGATPIGVYDMPIIDVLTKSTEGTETVGYWIKVQYDGTSFMSTWPTSASPASATVYYVEPYTPFTNASYSDQVYYEFGENYNIITDINGNLAHEGSIKNQIIQNTGQPVAAQPSEYYMYKGDVYGRLRSNGHKVLDMSVSDKYGSKLDGNGRALVEDDYAKEIYYPTTIRYSLEYEPNTNINNTNKFLAGNLDEYDRQKGDIQRLKVRGQQMRVFQSRACGMVPISQNVIQTGDGSIVSQSTEALNKIQYYLGEHGIGEQYCSLASSAQADYFIDPVLGAQVRLSQDGVTSLTEIYKAHFFFTDKIGKYKKADYADKFANGGYAKILSTFDGFEEELVTCMQGSGTDLPDYTFAFSETRNCYTSFYDYYPEWITSAGNVLITWKDGALWVHNNTTTYANFYGVQQTPSIKLVYNQFPNMKKHYNTFTTLGNTYWTCPTNADIITNMGHNSTLLQTDYRIKDDKYHAAFKRDVNSVGGLFNGRPLKGAWIEMNLKPVNPQNLVDLYYTEIVIQEPLNNR